LGRYVEPGETLTATGLKPINLPNRAVDLNHGQQVYKKVCVVCHGNQGEGQLGVDGTYEYPPLWGPMAYNNGAGMTRVITAAQFIKYNMPYGINYKTPQLTDAEAYDVAGYINQQSRPQKKNLAADFPNRLKKPVSTPYPPYADSFTQTQHALGPFQPIIEYYAKVHQITKRK
jgi:thiosulfate dehydrogenase